MNNNVDDYDHGDNDDVCSSNLYFQRYKNEILTNPNTALSIAVRCHQRSPWAHLADDNNTCNNVYNNGNDNIDKDFDDDNNHKGNDDDKVNDTDNVNSNNISYNKGLRAHFKFT